LIDITVSIATWLGAALIVLADGRRGLALGAAFTGGGLALAAYPSGGLAGALILAAGGIAAAAWRARVGPAGWRIMPAGSTPRLVLCVAAALLTLWIALSVTSGPNVGLRFSVIVAAGLAVARMLGSDDRSILMSAVAILALAAGASTGLAGGGGATWTYAVAALVAAACGVLPSGARRAG
jgi:hypothetical protein